MPLMGLSAEDLDFLELVSEAAFANPFGARRAELDEALSGRPEGDPALVDVLTDRVSARLSNIKAHIEDLDRSALGEREEALFTSAVAFAQFHRFVPQMDALLRRQLRESEAVAVPFAADLLRELTAQGFDVARAEHLVALFYQMRRAWFFIDESLVGTSGCMQTLREGLWNAVFTRDVRRYEATLHSKMEDFSILLLGETGTGKGAAAAAVGRSAYIPFDGKRMAFATHFDDAFVPINLSQFSESLLESELFGHKKGAFTGAIEAFMGVLGRCKPHGTIFLDEIGEISSTVQIKLLRVLQDRVYSPVGSHQQLRFEGRVLAATNRSLPELRGPDGFRDDFYYRLSSQHVFLPALRLRVQEDASELDRLIENLLARMLGVRVAPPPLLDDVRTAVHRDVPGDYPWPGNVRELEQSLRRVLLTGRCVPEGSAAPQAPAKAYDSPFLSAVASGTLSSEEVLQGYCALLYEQLGTFVDVARRTGLDRRTVKKYVDSSRRE